MVHGEESFLADQQWRDLPKPDTNGLASQEERGLRLRAELCEYLIEMPNLVLKSRRLALPDGDVQSEIKCRAVAANLRMQVTEMMSSLETWLAREVEPLLFRPRPPGIAETGETSGLEGGLRYPGPGLLGPIVDCVANTALMMLDRLALSLGLREGQYRVGAALCLSDKYPERKSRAEGALAHVKTKSGVCAKPLEVGLHQLSTNGGVLDPGPRRMSSI